MLSSAKILGVRVDRVSMDETVAMAGRFLASEKQHIIATVNPEFILEARRNPKFREVLNRADLAVADGVGIVILSKVMGWGIRHRVTGVDLCSRLFALAEQERISVFCFGSQHDVPQKLDALLHERHPALQLVGCEHEIGQNGVKRTEDETVARINAAKPTLLLVALGAPQQELWIERNLSRMPSVRLAIGVGGAFDMLTGTLPRAPTLFRRLGLEWLWRVIIQPSRVRRIVRATIVFPLTVLFHQRNSVS